MPTPIQINRLTNCNVYVNGTSQLGRCEEAKVPAIKNVMSEHKALGMIAKVELPSGIDKMEADFKWASFYPDILPTLANPFKAVALQVRGSLQTWDDSGLVAELPLVVHLRGQFKEVSFGDYKPQNPAEFPSKFSVSYVKCVSDGRELYEIDALSNILKVDGVDLLATYRQNIGG
jgi:P2 family phage contractile tail tube protein